MESTGAVVNDNEQKLPELLNEKLTSSMESAISPARNKKNPNMSTYLKMCKTSNSPLFVTPVRTVAYQPATPSSQTKTNGYKGKKLFDLLKEMETKTECPEAVTAAQSESTEVAQRPTRRSIDYVKTPVKTSNLNESRSSIRIML